MDTKELYLYKIQDIETGLYYSKTYPYWSKSGTAWKNLGAIRYHVLKNPKLAGKNVYITKIQLCTIEVFSKEEVLNGSAQKSTVKLAKESISKVKIKDKVSKNRINNIDY